MKKLLLYFLLFLSYFNVNAQLDREHWFAPMMDRVSGSFTSQYQSMYMSTNETTPFKVEIYQNNVLVNTVTLSKNNPVKYTINNRSSIITTSQNDLFKPVGMGYYLKGEKPFFASLRFSITNHGEIQTSKGTAGLGTEFRAVMAPISVSNSILNFMNSVMATEDNTQVTISGFNSNVRFSDNVTRTSITFTLNKGQSYIIDGRGNVAGNFTGYIGAKIVSTKPVVIANGNFNGQYAGNFSNSSDILMDQGVPVDRLGKDFVLMKGNGDVSSTMESAIVVANEDGTQIFLNNNQVTPIATINAGQHYIARAYQNQGSGHYNMYVRTSKNAYVYQLLAGASDYDGTTEATGGFNYIPPLSCYLPVKIDEIGRIEENEYTSNGVSYSLAVPTKLNIITERGATIKVYRNGTLLTTNANNGPFNVTGNPSWVTYSIPNITGNISVESTHAVTAGISAGNDAVGYGGYFAGFSYIPAIIKSAGDCLPGVKLEVTEGFNNYQWLIKNASGGYDPAPGINNTNTYEPTQAGIYSVKIQQGSCPEIQTADFKFYNCTTFTNIDHTICTTTTITPNFVLSSQTLNATTVKIDTPPTKGTAVVNPDGTITYTANPNAIGQDTFKYSFCGAGSIPDCETVQATVNLNQIEKYDVELSECTINGTAAFNLTSAAVTPNTGITKTYYLDAALTQMIPAGQLANYSSSDRIVYVKMVNGFGCETVAQITLRTKRLADVNPALFTRTYCDDEIDNVVDGIFKADLTQITPIVVANSATFTTKYYASLAAANAGGTDNITGIFSFNTTTSVWIRVESPDGCPAVIKEIQLKTGSKITLITAETSIKVCDNDRNGTETILLSDYNTLFYAGTATISYFATLANAQNNVNPITNLSQAITANKTFYYRITVAGSCDDIGKLNVEFFQSTPSTTLLPTYTTCTTGSVNVNVGTSYTTIFWPHNSSSAAAQTLTPGTYTVQLTNANGCTYSQNVTVNGVAPVVLTPAAFNGIKCDTNFDGKIEINFSTEVTPLVVPTAAGSTVRYFANTADANAEVNPLPNIWTYSAATTFVVRVDSQYCPPVFAQIAVGFAASTPLLTTESTQIVCDNGNNGSEAVNLSLYEPLFYSGLSSSFKYYTTLQNAQNGTNAVSANQTINATTVYYYRISSAAGCDSIGKLTLDFKKPTPSTALQAQYYVCNNGTSTTTLNVGTGFSSVVWSTGETTTTIDAGVGDYWVDLTNSFGCVHRQNVKVLGYAVANPRMNLFKGARCDENFDGKIEVKFSTEITSVLLTNANLYTVTYHLNPAGTDAALPDNWSYTTATTVYMKIASPYCAQIIQPLAFTFGNKITLLSSSHSVNVCDDNLDGIKEVDLSDYKFIFNTNTSLVATYFSSLANAQSNTNPISNIVMASGTKTYYIRFESGTLCPEIGAITVTIKTPKISTDLEDQNICPNTQTLVDAGVGFEFYTWKDSSGTVIASGVNASSIVVGAGTYTVELTYDGCSYTQEVKISEVELPTITSVEVNGNTITVNVTGGNAPYSYSLNGIVYQNSNVLTNVPYGINTIYVKSSDDCNPVKLDFTVIRLLNVITPNGDGYNDYIDYSDLNYKEDVHFKVFDRNGAVIFIGDKNNNYKWDGKINGKTIPTSSYWYILQWKDPNVDTIIQHKGWILLKNRNND